MHPCHCSPQLHISYILSHMQRRGNWSYSGIMPIRIINLLWRAMWECISIINNVVARSRNSPPMTEIEEASHIKLRNSPLQAAARLCWTVLYQWAGTESRRSSIWSMEELVDATRTCFSHVLNMYRLWYRSMNLLYRFPPKETEGYSSFLWVLCISHTDIKSWSVIAHSIPRILAHRICS